MENLIVIDVESDVYNQSPYNIGYVISNGKEILLERNIVLFNHFRENAYAMYAKENFNYIRENKKEYKTYNEDDDFVYDFMEDIQKFNVKNFFAYNVKFDWKKIGKLVGESFLKEQFGSPCDIMTAAFHKIMNNPSYLNYCKENNYKTEKGYPSSTFEVVYRYLTNNKDYHEVHRGLEDAKDEYDLLRRLNFESKEGWKPIQPWRRMGKI